MKKRRLNFEHLKSVNGLSWIIVIVCGLFLQGCVPTQGGGAAHMNNIFGHSQTVAPPAGQVLPGQTQVRPLEPYYTGYSKKYLPFRQQLAAGNVAEVERMMAAEEENFKKKNKTDMELAEQLRLIGLMERSSLFLQTGSPDKVIRYSRLAQELIEERESESYFKGGASAIGSFFADAAGAGELGRYEAPGYEKVMLLNIKSMAYLLKGDERSFNVAKLSIQWQDEEKEKFSKEISKVEDEEKDDKKQKKQNQQNRSTNIFQVLNTEFSKYNSAALTVPNAFVNPFGDYLVGMVNEFKSIELKSLLSNAHIAYKHALKLNPDSAVLKQAVKDTKKKKPASRLIHIVALDGFVPEKKVISIPVDGNLDVELPIFNPVPGRVAKIKVMTSQGKTLATLSQVADLEALALRHQKDSLPYIKTMLMTAVVRDAAIENAGNSIFGGLGSLVSRVMDSAQEPDTTSWMTLPATVMAARIYPKKGLKTLKIRSYDSEGKQLAEETVKLNDGNSHFVLVRTIDETMFAYPSKKIWSPQT